MKEGFSSLRLHKILECHEKGSYGEVKDMKSVVGD